MSAAPGTGVGAGRAGMAVFWLASMAVGVAAFLILAAVAHAGGPGELAAASAVISLSFVLAVVPGAIQLRAAADVAAGRPASLPRRFLLLTTLGLAAAALPAAALLAVPAASLGLLAAQYAAACVASAQRGAFIGLADYAAASRSMVAEAVVRIVGGIALGVWLGATGLAAALLLGSLGAVAISARSAGVAADAPWRGVVGPAITVGLLMVLVNVDALLVPRLLGADSADAYAVASLPVRGIFFALFTVSWLAVPVAVRATRRAELLAPVGLVLGLGAAAGLTLLVVRPLLPIALGDPAPSAPLLALLAAATALAAALATVLAMAVAREQPQAWAATAVACVALIAVLVVQRPSAEGVATLVLLAVAGALVSSAGRLLRLPSAHRSPSTGAALLARR